MMRHGGVALFGAVALLLTGCGPAAPEGNTAPDAVAEQSAPQEDAGDTGLTAEEITAAIEPQGFECAEEDPRFDDRAQVIVCRADDYVIISATRLVDAALVEDQLATAKSALCGTDIVDADAMRFAVSDAWILVPGGGDDANIAAFDTAMNTLGIDWTEDPC